MPLETWGPTMLLGRETGHNRGDRPNRVRVSETLDYSYRSGSGTQARRSGPV
jgi:hypothetical protein